MVLAQMAPRKRPRWKLWVLLRSSLPERPDRRGVGADQAGDPGGQARRQQAHGQRARGGQRADVCAEHRLPVARGPEGLCRREARSTTISAAGSMTARWPGCTMCSTSAAASMRAARPVRRRRSSTAKASRAPKRGRSDAGFDRRQEDRRQEAARPGRYARRLDGGVGACGRHPGSRWRRDADGEPVRAISVPAEALRRWRLSGAEAPTGLGPRLPRVNVEIVRRCATSKFVVLPTRWIVERTIAWLNRCRRLSKDWENPNRNALAVLRWALIRLMLRRLCQNYK